MMNEFNPDGKDIRFIDSHYRDLFRIPDGGTIQVHYSDDSVVIKPCKFIDEYHTQIGNNVFHICQFAELLERNGSYCQAEPEIMGDEAAWQVGRDQYLAIQTCEVTIRSLIKNFMRLMAVSWTIQSCLCWKHELKFWLDLDFR